MNRPLREHFEVPTDAGQALRTFDYIEELEKYINHLEALRQPDVSGSLPCHHNCIQKDTYWKACTHCGMLAPLGQ